MQWSLSISSSVTLTDGRNIYNLIAMHQNVNGMLNLQWWCGEKLDWGPTEVLLPWLHRCALCVCWRPLCSRRRPKPAEVWWLLCTCWFLPCWNITDHMRNLFIDTFKKKDNFYNQEKRNKGNVEKHEALIFQDFTLFFTITIETPLSLFFYTC